MLKVNADEIVRVEGLAGLDDAKGEMHELPHGGGDDHHLVFAFGAQPLAKGRDDGVVPQGDDRRIEERFAQAGAPSFDSTGSADEVPRLPESGHESAKAAQAAAWRKRVRGPNSASRIAAVASPMPGIDVSRSRCVRRSGC